MDKEKVEEYSRLVNEIYGTRDQMDYQKIKQKVDAVLKAGGFSSDEPLDSIKIISGSYESDIPAFKIGALSSVLASFEEWDRAEAVARSIRNNDDEMGSALAILAQDLAAADLLDRAEAVARSITNSVELVSCSRRRWR